MDTAVRLGDDFYEYANGSWEHRIQIRPDRADESPSSDIYDEHEKKLQDLIEASAKAQDASSRRIADLYDSYMDEAAIEAAGLKPLQPHLAATAAIADKHQLAHALGETLRADVDALNMSNFYTSHLFGLWVAPGFDDSDHYTAYLMQGGLMLPDREYFLSNSAEMRELLSKYQQHVAGVLKQTGLDDTDKRAARIVALEARDAQAPYLSMAPLNQYMLLLLVLLGASEKPTEGSSFPSSEGSQQNFGYPIQALFWLEWAAMPPQLFVVASEPLCHPA
jgi:endothelin-converting enzyme/putative endopeptidase